MKYIQTKKTINLVNIDQKDRKILSVLAVNSRYSISRIAKLVGISRDSAESRLNKFQRSGMIQGYRSIVNLKKFGYGNYHIFISVKKMDAQTEILKLDKLKKLNFVRAILKFSGKYDYEIAIVSKNTDEFQVALDKINNLFDENIIDMEILIIIKDLQTGPFPQSFISQNDRIFAQIDYKLDNTKNNSYLADETDINILKIISNDARINLYKVADKLSLSSDTINYRLKKLIDSGYITKFIPVIDYDIIGYHIYTILMRVNSLTTKQESSINNFFKMNKNILWAVKCIGRFNYLFYVCSKDTNDLHNTISELRDIFPEKIKEYETLIACEEFKFTYLPENLDLNK